MPSKEIYDVIVIGGGPAGLTAAQYAARAGLDVVVLQKPQSSGALALSGRIENYPGFPDGISGRDLLQIFREQAEKFGAKLEEEEVTGVNLVGEVKEIFTLGRTCLARTVILATGSMARKAGIPGEAEFLGKGVSYCATCDAPFFRGLNVCVVGDSNEAQHEAEHLLSFAKNVYLLNSAKKRRPEGLHPAIQFLPHSRLTAINGDQVVNKIHITNLDDNSIQELAMDGVFVYLHGASPAVDFLEDAVAKGERSCILTHQSAATSTPGVYAAGDVTCLAVRQVVVSAAFGCIAALEAEKYLRQRKQLRYDWSKSNTE